MKYIALFLLLLVPLSAYSNDESFVKIYKTRDNGLYGRSQTRDIILEVKSSVFKRHNTYRIDNPEEFLTGVVISATTVERLNQLFLNRSYIQFGYTRITRDNNIYKLMDDNLLLEMEFSFEKPNPKVLAVVDTVYPGTSKFRAIVKDHYRENYVIRVHSAENFIDSDVKEITYSEAIAMATIIGDKDQWLWGIHDGRGYLEDLLGNF